jgi:hypothetical protein
MIVAKNLFIPSPWDIKTAHGHTGPVDNDPPYVICLDTLLGLNLENHKVGTYRTLRKIKIIEKQLENIQIQQSKDEEAKSTDEAIKSQETQLNRKN